MEAIPTKNDLLRKSKPTLADLVISLSLEINSLKDRLAKNSRNSSKPPSTDGYERPTPKSRRKKSKKKVGGQPGHEGSTLEMSDTPDVVDYHAAEICERCGRDISEVISEDHECRQEIDIKPEPVVVTEHRAEVKTCPYCGYINRGDFPKHLTKAVQYGAGIKARASYYNQYHFIPYDRLEQLFEDCHGLSISQGSFVNFNNQCAQHILPSVEAIKEMLINGEVAQFDESGMRVSTHLHWLHVASTAKATYYDIHAKRGQEAIDEINILPQFKGIAIHDHWKPYLSYDHCEHGLCNAHHIRELEFMVERHEQTWAKKLIELLLEIKEEVDRHKQRGKKKLPKKRINYYERKYSRLLREGRAEIPDDPLATLEPKRGKKKQHKAKNLWDRLRDYKQSVLLFMYDFRVPFTNNLPERDIRMCKVKSKVSGCFRSQTGSKTFCRLRSYISTARKQRQHVLSALEDAFLGQPFMPT